MDATGRASLLVLAKAPVSEAARAALEASAARLEYTAPVRFASLSELAADARLAAEAQQASVDALALFVHEVDPWCVVALDDAGIEALRDAFAPDVALFAPDEPAEAHGYKLVAVPGFEACMDDQEAKRVAWRRLQAAKHPKRPV